MASFVQLPNVVDFRGDLTHIEAEKTIPFEIKRVYFIHGVPVGAERGGHAHKNLKQVIIAAAGSFTVSLENSEGREEVVMDSPDRGLYLHALTWREMSNFSPGTVCLVLASEYFSENDYIREYDVFKEMIRI